MMTQEESLKVIAEGVAPEQICPMIDEIGRQVAAGFEIAAECSFVNGEDEIIFDLIMRLLANGMFMEAVDVLTLAFSLAEEDKAYALTALIANSGRDDVYRMFLQSFTENSGRCEVRYILVGLPDELN
jgi:hypothetical protein